MKTTSPVRVALVTFEGAAALSCLGSRVTDVEHIIACDLGLSVEKVVAKLREYRLPEELVEVGSTVCVIVPSLLDRGAVRAANFVRERVFGLPYKAPTRVRLPSSQSGLAAATGR